MKNNKCTHENIDCGDKYDVCRWCGAKWYCNHYDTYGDDDDEM